MGATWVPHFALTHHGCHVSLYDFHEKADRVKGGQCPLVDIGFAERTVSESFRVASIRTRYEHFFARCMLESTQAGCCNLCDGFLKQAESQNAVTRTGR